MITILMFLTSFIISPSCDKMQEVRSMYNNIKTEQDLVKFVEFTQPLKCEKTKSYLASAEMQKAQYAITPWKKYGHFKKGKKELEAFIKKNPNDLEARYLRFLVQSNAPFFLGYRSEIKNDYNMIQKNIKEYDLPDDYKKQILKHLNEFSKE